MERLRTRQEGFTLIELMVSVALVAILSAIAIPNFQRYIMRTRQAEAYTIMGMIKQQEYAYFSSHDCFAATERMPALDPSPVPQGWTSMSSGFFEPCTNAALTFSDVGVEPNQNQVYFVYECAATLPAANAGAGNFTCSARGDLDADLAEFEMLYCTDLDGDGVGLESPGPSGAICTIPYDPIRVSPGIY
jgi:prepilin-type N-terminal cleavage/methylation domain-containing protein